MGDPGGVGVSTGVRCGDRRRRRGGARRRGGDRRWRGCRRRHLARRAGLRRGQRRIEPGSGRRSSCPPCRATSRSRRGLPAARASWPLGLAEVEVDLLLWLRRCRRGARVRRAGWRGRLEVAAALLPDLAGLGLDPQLGVDRVPRGRDVAGGEDLVDAAYRVVAGQLAARGVDLRVDDAVGPQEVTHRQLVFSAAPRPCSRAR